jgi:hypothetical protein
MKDDSNTKNITSHIIRGFLRFKICYLGSNISWSTTTRKQLVIPYLSGESKIYNNALKVAFRSKHYILRFNISMHYIKLMQMIQS